MAVQRDNFEYHFDPASLVKLRAQLRLTQSALADLLSLPVNTVSRWERAASAPDAHALAALYSIAARSGVKPRFFARALDDSAATATRRRLIFMWDLTSAMVPSTHAHSEWQSMSEYLNLMQPGARSDRQLRIFGRPADAETADGLGPDKFQTRTAEFGLEAQLMEEARHLSSRDPAATVFVIAAGSAAYASFIREIRRRGVSAYLWSPADADADLRNSFDQGNIINWNAPRVVTKGFELAADLAGEQISRELFNERLRDSLIESDVTPTDAGFTETNPYSNVIDWLERKGVIEVSGTPDEPGTVCITIPKRLRQQKAEALVDSN